MKTIWGRLTLECYRQPGDTQKAPWYLVPRDGKICLDISYMGLMDLAMSTGSILWAQAELVYEHDAFALNGFDKPPTHQYNPFSKDRGAIVGVYVVVKTPDGDYLTDCMSKDEVDAIMNRSP